MRSPIKWFGGKGNMVAKLLPLIPKHKTYVEVFGGGASLLFAKTPSEVEVYNDLNKDLVHFYKVLRDPDMFQEFYHKVSLTPYSREIYNEYRKTWFDIEDPVERAYRWFMIARMSFSGDFAHAWGFARTVSCRGMSITTSGYLSAIERLPEIHERIMRVQIECDSFEKIIFNYDREDGETFFYCDPPYVHSIRDKISRYKHEMTDEQHELLIDMLLKVKGWVLVSGYNNPLYERLEHNGWIRKDFKTVCYATARTRGTGILGEGSALKEQARTESVWMNYIPI